MKQPLSLKEQGIEGRVVLLFSGGIDSFVGRHYLAKQHADFVCAYFWLSTQYTNKEWRAVQMMEPAVKADYTLTWLGDYESGSSAFVPYRNLYLAMTASLKYAPNVCICGVLDDKVPDKSEEVFQEWSEHLSKIGKQKVKVFSPFWQMRKHEVVEWYLENGGTENEINGTLSCYSPTPKHYCGHCKACFRKFIALRANGIDILFYNTELAREYYDAVLANKYDAGRAKVTLRVLKEYFGFCEEETSLKVT